MCSRASVLFIYTFILCVIQHDASFLSTSYAVNAKYKRQANCTVTNKFQCNSGECIDEDLICDGRGDCIDNSDETAETCSHSWCLKTTYRCKYGACVHFFARCNGIKDCIDGSDEIFCPDELLPESVPKPSPFDNGCVVPKHPKSGVYTNGHTTYKPNRFVMEYDPLFIECNRGFGPNFPDQKLSICFNGSWVPQPNTCSRTCQSLEPTAITDISCVLRGKPLDSCDEPVEETRAIVTCAEGYEEPTLIESKICKNGSWGYNFPECIPVCGLKRSEELTEIEIDGRIVQKSNYPWHVGIYNRSDGSYLCTGSIISERIILTAASCIMDFSKEKVNSKQEHFVAVGKYYRNINDDRDNAARYYIVGNVHIPSQYQAEVNNYEADIAVVVLARKLRLSKSVQPICVDWEGDLQIHNLSRNASRMEIGWDHTKELREQNVSVQLYDEYKNNVAEDCKNYLVSDKLYAEFLKNDSRSEIIGGGLTFQHTNGKYYLEGIASRRYPPLGETCQLKTYTLIRNYSHFISRYF